MSQSEPTVFVVDDDESMRDSLQIMAESIGLNVATFSSAQDFLDFYSPELPGCLVLDVRMPGMSGLVLQQTLLDRGIQLPVIVISGHADVPLAVRAVKTGALDFLEKPFIEQDLLDHIHAAFEVDQRIRINKSRSQLCAKQYESLTPREREAMLLLVKGLAGKEIAAAMEISYKTMEKFRAKVMHKMQARSLASLTLMAVSLGLVSVDDPNI